MHAGRLHGKQEPCQPEKIAAMIWGRNVATSIAMVKNRLARTYNRFGQLPLLSESGPSPAISTASFFESNDTSSVGYDTSRDIGQQLLLSHRNRREGDLVLGDCGNELQFPRAKMTPFLIPLFSRRTACTN